MALNPDGTTGDGTGYSDPNVVITPGQEQPADFDPNYTPPTDHTAEIIDLLHQIVGRLDVLERQVNHNLEHQHEPAPIYEGHVTLHPIGGPPPTGAYEPTPTEGSIDPPTPMG